jgi:hypothetical protein
MKDMFEAGEDIKSMLQLRRKSHLLEYFNTVRMIQLENRTWSAY